VSTKAPKAPGGEAASVTGFVNYQIALEIG